MPFRRPLTLPLALHSEVKSPLQGTSAYAIPWEPLCGGFCRQTASLDGHRTEPTTIWHARDGVWSCEGVI